MGEELHMSQVLTILGVSLYVLGFGLGPLVFAPLGEMYGRVTNSAQCMLSWSAPLTQGHYPHAHSG